MALAACSSSSPPNATGSTAAWSANSATDETKSTHLWIVNRAIDILSKHTIDVASATNTLAWLNDATCKTNWQNGLLQADYLAPFNAGATDLPVPQEPASTGCCCGVDTTSTVVTNIESDLNVFNDHSTWLTHFYDPTSGFDYDGYAMSSDMPSMATLAAPFLYKVRQVLEADGNAVPVEARGAALYRFDRVVDLLEGITVDSDSQNEPSDLRARGCYELGLVMHYTTDITQPMHAANFAANQHPDLLHSNFEEYARTIQSNFVLSDWGQTPASNAATADVLQQIAMVSHNHWYNADGSDGPLKAAFNTAYQAASQWDASGNPTSSAECLAAKIESKGTLTKITLDIPKCWQNNQTVTQETGSALQDAEQSAAYVLATLNLPVYTATGPAAAPGSVAEGTDSGLSSGDDGGGSSNEAGDDGGDDANDGGAE
jgi:phospholipase C